MQEAALMAQLRHPNIVSLVGVCTAGAPKILVLQYCEHGALRDLLQRRAGGGDALPPAARHRILLDVAKGMHFLARLHVVHRDLAARNVLVATDYTCKIADFGLSRELPAGDAEYYASALGMVPLRWTAPEALFKRHFSSASDVWAYGVFCGEVFDDGALPYLGLRNDQIWLRMEGGAGPDCPATCPPAFFAAAVAPCFAAEPGLRPTFAQLVVWLTQWPAFVAAQTTVDAGSVGGVAGEPAPAAGEMAGYVSPAAACSGRWSWGSPPRSPRDSHESAVADNFYSTLQGNARLSSDESVGGHPPPSPALIVIPAAASDSDPPAVSAGPAGAPAEAGSWRSGEAGAGAISMV